ncbi:hypothetical protein MMYC01_200938 [Madurella mycetomatis]|uniref:Rhodopsin domain-containing protein n=1 Tax=Madurella mycetomatis TaxID=100816 RepID=A0A175WEI1_9PEZI|nr:hypothetical protein MMYC01_200938 [Madurella mycetomatis]
MCGISSHHERSYTIIIYTFVVATALLVALRFIARLRTRAPLWWDDYSVLVSLLVAIAFTAVCGVYDSLGVGLDIWAVPQENFVTIFILLEAALLCYAVSRCFVRISICLFLMRIFSIPGARPYIVLGLVLNVLISISFTFCVIFQCWPVSHFWNGWDGLHEGYCVSQWTMFLAGGIIATALDLYFIVLPVLWVAQLQLSRMKKILTAGMLSLGVIVIITSVMRVVALYNFTHSTNLTRRLPELVIWGGLELDVAIIVRACLPSLGPLLKPVGSHVKSWVSKSGGSSSDASRPFQSSGHKRLVDSSGGYHAQLSKTDQPSDIRLTTTIQQRQGPPSESETSLTMHEIELYDRQRGQVQGHVWT